MRQRGYLTIGLAIALAVMTLATVAAANWARVQTEKRAEVEGKFNSFKADVDEKGKVAAKAAKDKEDQDRKRQEKADAENDRTITDLRARIARLREQPGSNFSGGSMSPAPAGSRCPETQTCFDRAEYQRTDGAFVKGARGLADEGSEVEADLNTARLWAQDTHK